MGNELPVADPFAAVREALAGYGPPIVVFNKSHSGSRVLARLLKRSGIFMGNELNQSEDALPLVPLVERLVVGTYPDYARLFTTRDDALNDLILAGFARHLAGWKGGRWGWKLCETAYILPLVNAVFPNARYVHLLRDGRDVAFANHVAPRTAFWKKIYFNTDSIRRWRGLPLSSLTYRALAPLYNARHWANSVSVGRQAGTMMGERYIEVRYEDLVRDFVRTATDLFSALDIAGDPSVVAAMAGEVHAASVGKHRRRSPFLRWLAMRELEPTLSAFGYGDGSRTDAR